MALAQFLINEQVDLNQARAEYQLIAIVIYRSPKIAKENIRQHIATKAEGISFGLERYLPFFDQIITTDKTTYLKKYDFLNWSINQQPDI